MRPDLIRLSLRLFVFYLVTFGGLMWVVFNYPDARPYLPVDGIDGLASGIFHGPPEAQVATPEFSEERAITLLASLVGAVVFVLPIVACYRQTRQKVRASIVEAMVLLPVVVTMVVFVVQNSVALAFSLAGIVAAVRFRYSLRSPADAVFIFAAIGVGIAAGVAEVGVAGAGSIAFNATAIGLAFSRLNASGSEQAVKTES